MMRARAALYRHLQALFEMELRDLYRLSDFISYQPQPAEEHTERKRRWAYGKLKEIVEGRFGDFEILLASPNEVPPLGRVTLRYRNSQILTGALDSVTFAKIGAAVKHHQLEKV